MAQSRSSIFARFVADELYKLCEQKRTGTFLAVTVDNLLAQFGLRQGEIVSLSFQHKQGTEALNLLQRQEGKPGVSRFMDGHLPATRLDLPPTDLILEQLLGKSDPASGLVDPRSVRMLSEQTKTVLQEELIEFIGPMAVIVCEEVWSTVKGLEAALDALSRELPDSNQAARFRQNVLKRLS
ncbi:MAG TPA: hypothetical protein PKY50_03835 [Candidatus Competibacter sp.]|nr:hypothetical protein [Candidatus Competibacter sp.]